MVEEPKEPETPESKVVEEEEPVHAEDDREVLNISDFCGFITINHRWKRLFCVL